SMFRKELLAQYPVGVENVTFLEINGVVVFDQTPWLYIRQRERLGQVLKAACLYDFLFIDFAVKIRDCAVGPYGSRLNAVNIRLVLDEGDFHVRVLAPFFREDLFPNIVVFVRSPAAAIVTVNLAVEDNCRRTGCLWFARHLQFLRRNGHPLVSAHFPCALQRRSYRRHCYEQPCPPMLQGSYRGLNSQASCHLSALRNQC